MRIGEIAKEIGLNISNIRFYERKGLLSPRRENDSKYRDYTEEDVMRIKQILLYRKMGIPIETIFLLLNNKTKLEDVLLRQQENLKSEISNLNSSLNLCEMMINRGFDDLSQSQIDDYLNYIYQEEEKGVKFAEVTELLEDITEYTRDSLPHMSFLWIYHRPWVCTVFALLFWCLLLFCPIAHIIDVIIGNATLSIPLLIIYAFILIIYSYGFIKFRIYKRKHDRKTFVEEDGEDA